MAQETVVIEGTVRGMRFSKTILLTYNPAEKTLEEAIIEYYHSQARTFDELAIQRGWEECYWTFPSYFRVM